MIGEHSQDLAEMAKNKDAKKEKRHELNIFKKYCLAHSIELAIWTQVGR